MNSTVKTPQPAFQRWQMTSFGDERPSAVAKREAEQRQRDAEAAQQAALQHEQEELERLAQEQQDMGPPNPPPPSYPTVEELEAIREQARQEGYEEGHAAGHADGHAKAMEEGQQRTDAVLAELHKLAESFGAAVQQADQLIANDVLELALHRAKNMLKTAL